MGRLRVAVAGGGIAGLATALALRQRGIVATVYERAPALREVGAGIALWPNATRALARLGVLDEVAARSGRAEAVRILNPAGETLLRFSTARPDAPSLCVRRRDLVGVLADALGSEAIHYGSTISEAESRSGGVRVVRENGAVMEADVLVAADGIRSRLRETCVASNPPVYQGYTAWRGLGPRPHDLTGDAFEAWGDGLRFGLFSLDGGQCYWYALASRPPGQQDTDDPHTELSHLFVDWHPRVRRVIAATSRGDVARHDVVGLRRSRPWVAGRVVLVGDAAHGMTPDLGQGGAFALEDAVALAAHLGAEVDVVTALRGYEHERRRRAASVRRRSQASGWLGQLGGRAGRVRNRVARLTPPPLFESAFTAPF